MQPETNATDGILFLCLARDCEASLPNFFAYLDALRASGIPCSAIVGENGSQDKTRTLLQQASNRGITYLDTDAMSTGNGRMQRMAIGRQLLMEAARSHLPARFVCVADLDNVMEQPPSVESVHNAMATLRQEPEFFAVSANSKPLYYDLLALRAPGHDYSPLHNAIQAAKRRPLTYHHFHQTRLYQPLQAVTANLPTACQSSFNGFCLYNSADFFTSNYRGPSELHICEHVTLNLSIAQQTGRQIQIARDLLVITPTDHTPVGFLRFWRDRLRLLFR